MKSVLAVVIISFSAYSLVRRHRSPLNDDRFAWLFGFGAGVLGGAYGMNGPPLVVYGALRGWSPANFRATFRATSFPPVMVGMIGYWAAGLWTPLVSRYYLISSASLVAIFLGRWINRRLDGHRFLLYVHMGLVAIGALLLIQAVRLAAKT